MPKVAPASERLYGPLAPGFGLRIEKALRIVGAKSAAAAVMGLSTDQVANIVAERAVPNFVSIAALAERAGCSLYWLAFGRGAQFINQISPRKSFSGAADTAAASFENPDVVLVRRFDLRFAAGSGAEVNEERLVTGLPFSRRYLEEVLRESVDDVAVGEASGDSMLPTIGDRDLVMVSLRRREIANGAVFVFRLGNELVVKRAQRDTDGSVLLISDNKAYPEKRLTQGEADSVDVIGRMIWTAGAV
jgi:phage repressor protein C with HTH and peptisase S24 domain